MSEVKSFFVAPHTGRMANEPKNAAIVSFVPGEVVAPEPPKPPETSATVGGGDTTSGGSTSSGGDSTGNGNNPEDPNFNQPEASAGCSVTPTQHHRNGYLLVLVGLGFIGLARRRREQQEVQS